jgi:hypothetical protein
LNQSDGRSFVVRVCCQQFAEELIRWHLFFVVAQHAG